MEEDIQNYSTAVMYRGRPCRLIKSERSSPSGSKDLEFRKLHINGTVN